MTTIPPRTPGFYHRSADGVWTQLGTPDVLPPAPLATPMVSYSALTDSSATLEWVSVQDATAYDVLRDGVRLTSTSGTSYTFTGLTAGVPVTLGVRAVSDDAVSEVASLTVTPTSQTPTPPPAPSALAVTSVAARSASVSFVAVTGASKYRASRDGVVVGEFTGTTYQFTELTPDTAYTLGVAAYNGVWGDAATVPARTAVDSNPPPPPPAEIPDYQWLGTYFPSLTSSHQVNTPVSDGRGLTEANCGAPSTGLTPTNATVITANQTRMRFDSGSMKTIDVPSGQVIVVRECHFRFGPVGGTTIEVRGGGHAVLIDCTIDGATTSGSYTSNLLMVRGNTSATIVRGLMLQSGADVMRANGKLLRLLQTNITRSRSLPGSHRDVVQGYNNKTSGARVEFYGAKISDPDPVYAEYSDGSFMDSLSSGATEEVITVEFRGCAVGRMSPVWQHASTHPPFTAIDNWLTPYNDTHTSDPGGAPSLVWGGISRVGTWENNRWWVSGSHKVSGTSTVPVTAGDVVTVDMVTGG